MIEINEYFLADMGSRYGFDQNLPLRLQKRVLLKALGFPGDPKLKNCRSCDTDRVEKFFKKYSAEGYPFLIIVSKRPMLTLVPPLFYVQDANRVQWRDDQGTRRIITTSKMLSIIRRYSKTTWVEFFPYLWRENTIAGRLIYIAWDNQILEIQQNTIPAKLINNKRLLTYVGNLNFLDVERCYYLEDSCYLHDAGYLSIFPFNMVRNICRKMPAITCFEELRIISRFPTVEFAITETSRLMVIDVDWPAQYIEKKGDNI